MEGLGLDIGLVDLINRAEGFVHGGADQHVFDAALVHGLALARFHELELRDFVGDAFKFDLQALAHIGCRICHGRFLVWSPKSRGGLRDGAGFAKQKEAGGSPAWMHPASGKQMAT
jgi:hypothetical protein